MIKRAENSSKPINLAFRYGAISCQGGKDCVPFIVDLLYNLQKAFEKHKIPQKEVYMDILGTDREKIPTPPKPRT